MRNRSKRLLSWLLLVAMLCTLLPTSVFAAEGTLLDQAIFCSDVHGSASDLSGTFASIKTAGVKASAAGFVGDTCLTVENTTSTVTNALGYTPSILFSYAASHDTENSADIADAWDKSFKAFENDYYMVYTIRETDMQNDSDAATAAPEFTSWVNGLTDAQRTKPLFIMSHRPLHDRRDDNAGATIWYAAISAAAEKMDIVFFWGHNHTSESDADTAAYYVAKDGTETFTVYNGSTVVPGFTYMNAGYINANNQNPGRINVATTVSIYADSMVFQDYNASGAYTGTYAHNVEVAREFASSSTSSKVLSSIFAVRNEEMYVVGEEFVAPTVTAIYEDSTTAEVEATVTGYDMSKPGVQTVTVTYTEGEVTKTTTYDIVVANEIKLTGTEFVTDDGTLTGITDLSVLEVLITYTCDISAAEELMAIGDVNITDNGDGTATVTECVAQTDSRVSVAGTLSDTHVTVTGKDTYGEASTTYYVKSSDTLEEVALQSLTASGTTVYTVGGTFVAPTITATYNDGTSKTITDYTVDATPDMTTAGTYTLTYTYTEDGKTVSTQFVVTVAAGVPEDAALSDITITTPGTVKYWTGSELSTAGLAVTAVYKDTEGTQYQKNVTDAAVLSGYDMNTPGQQTVTVSYTENDVTKTATFSIEVFQKVFTDEDTDITVEVESMGATAMTAEASENANVATAVGDLLKEGYAAYDITMEGFVTGTKATVSLPVPSGVTTPVIYYVSDDGNVAEIEAEISDGYAVFNTDKLGTFVVGESAEITLPEKETATGEDTITTTTTETKEVYVLVDSISEADDYLIVSANAATTSANMLTATNNGVTNTSSVTVVSGKDADGNTVIYIEDPAAAAIWTASGSSTWTLYNSSLRRYLRYDSDLTTTGQSDRATSWYSDSNALYRQQRSQSNGRPDSGSSSYTYYYVCYNNGWTTRTSSNSTTSGYPVYFYQKQEVEFTTTTNTTVSGTYSIAGEDISVAVSAGSTTDLTSTLTFTPESGTATTTDVSTTATYEIVTVDANGNTVNGDPKGIISKIENGVITFTGKYGTALVKVSYTTDFGVVTDYITVTATAPYYSIELHKATLTEVTGEYDANTTYYVYNETTRIYEKVEITAFEDGVTYYTTPVIKGEEIKETLVLKGIEVNDQYPIWAVIKEHTSDHPDGEDIGDVEDKLIEWIVSDPTIASIDPSTGVLTFTGKNYGTFTVTAYYKDAEGNVLCEDTIVISVTDSLYVVPGDGTDDFPTYPNEGAVRFDKHANAVGNYSETGIAQVELSMTGVPYTTDNAMDVVVMLDMTGSMSEDGMEAAEEATKAFVETIVQNEDGSYNSNRVAVYAFNSGDSSPYELVALNTISSDDELATANTAIDTASDKQASGGTPFDKATEQCYDVLQAAKTTNLPEGVASATDYDRQQFCVFMSDGGPTTYYGSDEKTYYGGNNNAGDVLLTTCMAGYSSSTSSDWSLTLPTEYYTDAMKEDGVTIYTVGLLLQTAPDNPAPYSSMTDSTYDSETDSLTTIGSHYYFTSGILKQMASDESKYIDIFNVDNADNATAKFTAIAQSILEAATDVVVEDKIGNNYTVNFSLPENVSVDATGMSEFYIQVVDYVLDTTTHERTGVYNVLENFTFNADGTLKSHTMDGAACGDTCGHVTFTDGVVTAIDGTYFDYKSDSTGEYLNWTADKITSTELCLQYFAYLDKSAGYEGNDATPAGTYYTNEYATLTYTNFKEEEVQQEFPVPQMTWNGAQVSYTFYLVNEAGQPVNRAGKVIPFAEAVYVTDVYTKAVVWNSLEQAAGLEAKYLADDIVPDEYALYDDNAEYKIHVYEDESKVNLNNHFVITGDVTDTYNIENGWTNAKTTYVFNNKSDATKYNVAGTYVADDGDTTSNENNMSYLCKSASLVGATYTTSVDAGGNTVYTVTSVGNGYQKVDGEEQVLANALNSTTGGTIIDGYVYYVDEYGEIYTIVKKTGATEVREGFDFSNTTVAFAVVWKPRLEEDVVVIDYGLDVIINVTVNDTMEPGVAGVASAVPGSISDRVINSGTYDDPAMATTADVYIDADSDADGLKELKIGKATALDLQNIRFSLDKENGMQFNKPATFYYESMVNYYPSGKTEITTDYMYSSVTVIPATTVYYEDEYVTLKTYTASESGDGTYEEKVGWDTSSVAATATQAQDRPGVSKLSAALDADNIYGYDGAYTNMSTYSMDNSAKVNVKAGKYATASFSFYGTGFDVVSMTSNTTGTMIVKIDGPTKKNLIVDTYYGYAMNEQGEWVISENDPNAIYQVPVITAEGLTYGKYTVTITASYNSYFDHTTDEGYDLYLDAIRIYDPTGVASGAATNEDVSNAYLADGEAYPIYQELRDNVIKAETFVNGNGDIADETTDEMTFGVVFIDSTDEVSDINIADYVSYGPNNELYLAEGQAIAFKVDQSYASILADVQLGIKVANGGSVSYKIYDASETTLAATEATEIKTTTDMYYSIKEISDGTIVVANTGGGILSLTNVKFTFTENPYGTSNSMLLLYMDTEGVDTVLMSMKTPEPDPEPTPDPEPDIWENPFTDVPAGRYFFDAVKYLTQNGVIKGETDTTFGPNSKTTRGMLVTMLWRLEGEPTAAKAGYSDVKASKYYAKAVDWASEAGIVQGYEDGTFRPEKAVSRQEIVTILYRYAQYKGVDVAGSGDLSQFSDMGKINNYAKKPMAWAVDKGVLQGYTDGIVRPTAGASRAEMATLLYRVLTNILGN